MLYLQHATILTPGQVIDDGAIIITSEHIAAVGPTDQLAAPDDAIVVEARGLTLTPGFIDLQLNGAFGLDFIMKNGNIRSLGSCWTCSRLRARTSRGWRRTPRRTGSTRSGTRPSCSRTTWRRARGSN